MTITEASDKYGVPASTIYDWIRRRVITPTIKNKVYDVSRYDILKARHSRNIMHNLNLIIKQHYKLDDEFITIRELEYRSELDIICNRRTAYTRLEKCLKLY